MRSDPPALSPVSPSPSSGPVGAGQPPAGGEEPVPGEGSAHGGEDAVQGGGGEHRRTQPPRVPGPARHDPGDHGWVHSRPGVGGRGSGCGTQGVRGHQINYVRFEFFIRFRTVFRFQYRFSLLLKHICWLSLVFFFTLFNLIQFYVSARFFSFFVMYFDRIFL